MTNFYLYNVISNALGTGSYKNGHKGCAGILLHGADMSGYVAYKSRRWTTCENCIQSLKTMRLQLKLQPNMISLLSRGYLIHLSESLIELIEI